MGRCVKVALGLKGDSWMEASFALELSTSLAHPAQMWLRPQSDISKPHRTSYKILVGFEEPPKVGRSGLASSVRAPGPWLPPVMVGPGTFRPHICY